MPRKKISAPEKETVLELGGKEGRSVPVICRMIRRYREALGIEQKELARRVGVSGNAVTNWENGRSRPDLNLIVPLCDALGVTLYELFDIDDPLLRQTPREKLLLVDYRGLTDSHKFVVDRLITSLKQVQSVSACPDITELTFFSKSFSAGIGDPSEFDDLGEPIYLYSSELVDSADCVFRVNGDSMEPELESGDLVLVQRWPDCPELTPGEMGAFIVGNECYVKIYQPDGLYSCNQNYPPMHFTDDQSVFFIGRVIGTLDPEDIADEEDVELYLSVREQA